MSEPAKASSGVGRPVVMIVVGVLLVVAGAAVGHLTEVAPRLRLDLTGERADGAIQDVPSLGYRVTYRHPAGVQWSETPFEGWIGLRRPGPEPMPVVVSYDPEHPDDFQPAGVSYVPAALVFVTTVMGLTSLLKGNRILRKRLLRRPAEPEPSASEDAAKTEPAPPES